MTVSDKQLQANRINALKGGVKTAEGKAKVKHNAVKHGLLTTEAVITVGGCSEAPEEFKRFLYSLQKELKPEGHDERILVMRITDSCWKLRRAYRQELKLIRNSMDNEPQSHPQDLTDFIQMCQEDIHELIAGIRQNLEAARGWLEEEMWLCLDESSDEQANNHDENIAVLDIQAVHGFRYKRKLKIMRRLCCIPSKEELELLLRYEGAIERQLYKLVHQLDSLQEKRSRA